MNRVLVALGSLAAAVGLVALVRPSVVAGLSLPGALVSLLGLLAIVQGARIAYGRYGADGPWENDPLPERRHVSTLPGESFDRTLTQAADRSRRTGAGERREVRDRLRSAAVAALTRYEGLSEATARQRLADGGWTDDPVAAAFFARGAVSPRLRDRLRGLVAGSYRVRATRAVDELSALADRTGRGRGEDGGTDGTDGREPRDR
jgi:hypothetical protein